MVNRYITCPIVLSGENKGWACIWVPPWSQSRAQKGVTFEQSPEYRVRGSHAVPWKKSISSEQTTKVKSLPRKDTWHISRTERLHIAGEEKVQSHRIREQDGAQIMKETLGCGQNLHLTQWDERLSVSAGCVRVVLETSWLHITSLYFLPFCGLTRLGPNRLGWPRPHV